MGSEPLGLGPFPDNFFNFTVRDGEIVAAEVAFSPSQTSFVSFVGQLWEPFAVWVSETHPDDAPLMYASWPKPDDPAFTERSIELWEQRIQDYVTAHE